MKRMCLLLLASAGCLAFADSNLYVGVGAGAGWNKTSSPAATFRINGGYNLNNYTSFEIGTVGVTQSGGGANQGVTFYDASVKLSVPMKNNALSFFTQIGMAYANPGSVGNPNYYSGNLSNNYTKAGWDALTAVGVQAKLTKQLALNLTNFYYFGSKFPENTGNTNIANFGVVYNF